VGYNNIDVAACAARGITVTNAPNVLTESTADLGFALMLAAARRLADSEHVLRAGRWQRWAYDGFCGVDVHGATLGVLGMGRIGQALARRGRFGFDMKVIYHNRSRLAPEFEAPLQARWVDKATLFREADHVVIVMPYSKASHHTVGAAELALMKPTATLTNVARGGLVDDAALARALAEGRIFAAGLDVFEGEPNVHPGLLAVRNVVLTPHIGSATRATRLKMATLAADNLIEVLNGRPALTPVAA
jgi:gluconate 2-dehydrogenase